LRGEDFIFSGDDAGFSGNDVVLRGDFRRLTYKTKKLHTYQWYIIMITVM